MLLCFEPCYPYLPYLEKSILSFALHFVMDSREPSFI